MKVKKRIEAETSFGKKLVASMALATYVSVLCPFAAFGEGAGTVEVHVVEKPIELEKSEVLIKAESGGKVVLGDASIEIPEGALKKDTAISITRISKVEDTGESICNAIPNSGGYRFLPAGTKFERDVTITLPYDRSLNGKKQSLEDLRTYFYDTEARRWTKLERIELDKEKCLVRSLSTHFTDMINATLTLPESASPVDVNLNSIKSLEAAKPDGHLLKFNPPKASNTGDASFSFELAIPSGRRGMQPQISIGYSSGGGNGMMGKGFDVNYGSAVSTDTRLGLPKYDTEDQYILDGVLLSEKSRNGNTVTYSPQRETSFSRIVRSGAGTDSDSWIVTDKNGTKRIYAQDKESCVGVGSRTFTWNMTRMEDANGNTVDYEYENSDGYVYPKEIRYTGFNGTKGNYSVKFEYDGGGEKRQDTRLDARSKSVTECGRLLTRISTHYGSFKEAIRKYDFAYKEGLAKESMLTSIEVSNNAGDSFEYEFEYTEPETDTDGRTIYFAEAEEWKNGSPLQIGRSSNFGGNFNAGAGVGFGTSAIDARGGGGVSGSVSSGEGSTEDTMVDMNGDGRVDAVSQDADGNIEVCLNNGNGFDSPTKIRAATGELPDEIGKENTSSSSFGYNFYAGTGLNMEKVSPNLGAGYSVVKQKSSSSSACSFMDMDRDGLVDIVEKGKSTYMRNRGNLVFEETRIYADGAIADIQQTISGEDAENYRKTYFVQTPFRMWKAPFDGVVSIRESAKAAGESYTPEKNTIVKTYKGSNHIDELEGEVVENAELNLEKSDLDIGKDEKIYFISDNGTEPINSDIEWSIEIEYKKAKILKNGYPLPFFNEDRLMEKKTYKCAKANNESVLDVAKKQFVEDFLKSEELLQLYTASESESTSENGFAEVTFTYDSGWRDAKTEEQKPAIFDALVKGGFISPAALTEEQFDEYRASVETSSEKSEDDWKEFAAQFAISVPNNMFVMREFKDDDKKKEFFNKYPMSGELAAKAMENYTVNGIPLNLQKESESHDMAKQVAGADGTRADSEAGTLLRLEGSGHRAMVIGASDGMPLLYDFDDGKLYAEKDGELSEPEFDCEATESDGKIRMSLNRDSNGTFESEVEILPKDISYIAENLSAKEMDAIVLDFHVEYADARDAHWILTGEEPLRESETESLFTSMNLSSGQKEAIIEALYDKKDMMKEVVSAETGEKRVAYDYSYYVMKENPDYEAAQSVLDDYRRSKVMTELFPFYTEAAGGYVLDKARIKNDEDKSLIESKCSEMHFGKCGTLEMTQHFEVEHLYDLTESGEFSCFMIDESLGVARKTGRVDKNRWLSAEDFSTKESVAALDSGRTKTIHEYFEYYEKSDKTKEEIPATVDVQSDENLYGGESGWFFGIWKGALSDEAFSEEKLTKSITVDETSYKERKEQLNSIKTLDDGNSKSVSGEESKVSFYLPTTFQKAFGDSSAIPEADFDTEIDKERVLCGAVAVDSEVSGSGKDKKTTSKFCAPFIFGDAIHANRSGGDSYYKIEGLHTGASESGGSGGTFLMPSLSRTFTDGEDTTKNASADVNLTVKEELPPLENNAYSELIENEGASASVSSGENNSESRVEQSVQDIDGDGIPDILQYEDKKLLVSKGVKEAESGETRYLEAKEFEGGGPISKNTTDANTKGGSASAAGSVSVRSVGKAKTTILTLNASSTPSVGASYSSGDSTQTQGLVDMNGDGLPDFFDGKKLKLNTGDGFVNKEGIFQSIADSLTKSETSSISVNFSKGKSLGGKEVNSLKSGASLSLGGSYSCSTSNTKSMMLDLNGDGLPDRITMTVGAESASVSYNTGSAFVDGGSIPVPGWENAIDLFSFVVQKDGSGFVPDAVGEIPIIGDEIEKTMEATVANPYDFAAEKYANSLEWNTSVTLGISGSLGANVNIPIPVPFTALSVNVTVNAGEGINHSSSISGVSVRMMDLDGDGLSDHVLRVPGTGTYWKRNISGRYGQLRKINLPQGGDVLLEYAEKYGTVENPSFKYVLSGVTTNDGCGGTLPELDHGEHSVAIFHEYSGGHYDRQRKEFYGFRTVKTTNPDGTWREDEYNNTEYYSKGCLKASVSYAKDGTVLSRSVTEILDDPTPLPAREESWTYEKSSGSGECVHTVTEYEYDEWGSCTRVAQDFGGGERLVGEISYDNSNLSDYVIGLPTDILVKDGDGKTLRHRAGSYDGKGRLVELHQYYDGMNHSTNRLGYDKYGNIASVTDGRGATLSYEYDGTDGMFVERTRQWGTGTGTYESEMKYDHGPQTKKLEKDCNGNSLEYEYDGWQRTTSVRTSYDTGETPAVFYEYSTPGKDGSGRHGLWHATTSNKVTFGTDGETIQTVVQIDGLGRAVRTAKTGFVNGKEGWNASGAVEYDRKGRTVKEGMTEFIEGNLEKLLSTTPRMTALFTSYEYDEKDRQVRTTLPDGSVQRAAFSISGGNAVARSIDPLGNVSVQESDSRGNIVRVAKEDGNGKVLTEVAYSYNAMGEMLKAFDAKGNPVSAEYDLLGRRTALESLDSGRQEFFYDDCSNLVRENSSVLRENGKQILYEYDGLNRLVRIDYPDTEDTVYTYGSASDKSVGAAGKILSVTDASGTLEYEYGKLGEVTKETRTLRTHLNSVNDTETSVMEYRSDYLGRMQWIVYPDGEKITYGYDRGGQVVSVTGGHWGHEFKYVTNILYDEYGQRTRIDYGNGTFTEYNYDPARRWLDSIKTENKWGQAYQNISYSFDAVGNVLGYENDCLGAAGGNYKTKQTYSYDNLYQLIKVSGETAYNPYRSSVPEFKSDYSQVFTFDTDGLGNMTSKVSTETVTPQKSIGDNLNYSFNYVYDGNYAHRLVSVGDRHYTYDSNGNIIEEKEGESMEGSESYHKITQEADDTYSTDYGWGLYKDDDNSSAKSSKYRRTYTWNERNQLISSVDSSYSTAYVYGQDGQRSNKYTQNSETLYFNKMWTLHTDSGNTVYGGQTAKNIYLGETRIVTKLNGGNSPTYQEEYYKQYFYHSDHLGSASLISDYNGDEYQRIEYTPYGETWVEKTSNTGMEYLPYKFTGKEMDEETGLYYYGARYLDPKYSMWISTDPALGEYIPIAPTNDEAKKHNSNLPGMGGVFNHINFNLYHYAGNNPVKYVDPDGREDFDFEHFLTNEIEKYVSSLENGFKLLFSSSSKKNTAQNQEKGSGIVFDAKAILENACNGFTFGGYATKDYPTSISTDGLAAASKYAQGAKNLNMLGNAFAVYNTYLDTSNAVSSIYTAMNPTNEYDRVFGAWNATFDCLTVGCDVVGFISPECALFSIPLGAGIQGTKFACEQGAIYSLYKEKQTLNGMSQFMFGVNIK
nr:hypothetical protein [Treponema sp.]